MPVDYRIRADLGLVVVRYESLAGHAETLDCMARCAAEPDFDPRFKHLFDFRAVTDVEDDTLSFLKMQARVSEVYADRTLELPMAFLTSNAVGQKMASLVRKSWSIDNRYIFVEATTDDQACDFLGLPPMDFAALFAVSRPLPSAR